METDKTVELHRIDQLFITVRTGLRCLFGCVVAYFVWKCVQSLAGAETTVLVNATLRLFATVSFIVPAAVAAALGTWAIGERKLRQRTVKHLQGRVITLEKRIDPKRTSSGLTTEGKTNPKDKTK